jgi:transposase
MKGLPLWSGKRTLIDPNQWDGLLLTMGARKCQTGVSTLLNRPGAVHYRFEKKESIMKLIRVGADLAKNVFQIHGVDRCEKAIWRRKLVRGDWIKALMDRIEPGCEIGMEACSGAHHWARLLQARGYTVKLVAAQFVKPYVKSNTSSLRILGRLQHAIRQLVEIQQCSLGQFNLLATSILRIGQYNPTFLSHRLQSAVDRGRRPKLIMRHHAAH